MNYDVGEIHYIKEYYFTDSQNKSVVKPRNTIICLSKFSTSQACQTMYNFSFSNQALLCCIVTDAGNDRYAHKIKCTDYKFLDHDSYACPTRIDMHTVDKTSFRGCLNKSDAKIFFIKLKNSIHSSYTENKICKNKFIKAAIFQEWKEFLGIAT
jgi:hypothetical protein